jgi:hypothetical protein
MWKEILQTKKGTGLRLVGLAVVFLTVMSLMACFVAIPPAVNYYKTKDAYVATVTLRVEAEKVYDAVVTVAEEKASEGKIEITNKAPQILYLEATDGVQTVSVKVNKVRKRETNMVITANIPDKEGVSEELEKNREKELAARTMTQICQVLNQNCTLVEQ